MRVHGTHYRTIWMDGACVRLIDQNRLPFELLVVDCPTHRETAACIRDMTVRGAPALGAAGAFAMAQAFAEALAADPWPYAREARARIESTRPTARDLFAGVEHAWAAAEAAPGSPADAALAAAQAFAEASVESCRRLGEHGAVLIPEGARVLTHCNAGWLATVDYGSALAPVYVAAAQGRAAHVWVDETRPRAQGARLTAWELANEELSHAVIADNAAAWFMSRGEVDLVIVGADRVAANGDVANKVGTYGLALAARAARIPFVAAGPSSSVDLRLAGGDAIEIEERPADEVLSVGGSLVSMAGTRVRNPAFDVTPAELVTAIFTERGKLTTREISRSVPPAG